MVKVSTISKIAFATAILVLSSCQKDNSNISSETPQSVSEAKVRLNNNEIDRFIEEKIQEKNEVFHWESASDEMLWNALVNTRDSLLAVGYVAGAKQQVVNLLLQSESRFRAKGYFEGFAASNEFDELNAVYFKVKGFETIQQLRKSGLIRYIYPASYSPEDNAEIRNGLRSESGCSGYVNDNTLVSGTHFFPMSPNTAKRSWSFDNAQIPGAWARTTGAGVGVMVIDAGVSQQQAIFTDANFKGAGSLTTRTLSLISRYPTTNFWGQVTGYETSPYTTCGHGTAMSGIVASPRNNLATACGVAYNCNFTSCRAVDDVIISNGTEEQGVAAAITLAKNTPSIKIVSMSLGSLTYRGVIADAVIALKATNQKLLFAAAGTSTTFTSWYGVIFPANMNEAVAVTGVTTLGARCGVCHSGSEVDFTAVMERASDGIKVITLTTNGFGINGVGGSSAATATTAGIAALAWGRNTSQTANDVLTRLRNNAAFKSSLSSQFGYGVINANGASY